jgi:hypothetical protein
MGLGVHNGVQLYMCGRCHGVTICFPSVQEKESRSTDQWRSLFINPISMIIHLNRETRYHTRKTLTDWLVCGNNRLAPSAESVQLGVSVISVTSHP